MLKPIIVVGSINLDLVVGVQRLPKPGETLTGHDFETFFGGKGANQAVAIARLGYPVQMIGRVGDDAFGPRLRGALQQAGVDVRAVRPVRGASGVALIATERGGQNSIIVVPGSNAALTPADLEPYAPRLQCAGMILCQLEIPLSTVERLAEMAGQFQVPLMLDPAPARALSSRLLRRVTWLTPNESEAVALCATSGPRPTPANAPSMADALLRRGVRNVALKLGAQGAYLANALGGVYIPAWRVTAVDCTAAGDAFNAGLAIALMEGATMGQAGRFAAAVAALSTTQPGAQPSMPTRASVRRLLKHGSPAAASLGQ